MKTASTIGTNAKSATKWTVLLISKRDWLADLSCSALLLFAFFPIFTALLGRWINYVRYIAVMGFLISAIVRDRKLFGRIIIILGIGFLFNLYYYYQLWRLTTTFPAFMAKSMLCWVYSCFALYYGKYGSLQAKKSIQTLWMIILVVTAITTIISVGENPIAARVLANANIYDTAETTALYLKNTASWGIIFGMVFTLPMWIAQFKRTKNPWYMVVIVSVTVCAIVAQITFAIFFAIAFLLCFFLHKLDVKKIFILIIMLIIFMLFFQSVLAKILYMIYDNLEGASADVLKTRVYQVYLIFNSGQITGDADVRVTLYTYSLMTFLRNPLLGFHMDCLNYNIIGMHSQLFDLMAATGVLGLLAYSGIYAYIVRRTYTHFGDESIKMYFMISAIILALFMLVNPVWYAPESFMSVFFLPYLIDDTKR